MKEVFDKKHVVLELLALFHAHFAVSGLSIDSAYMHVKYKDGY